MQYARFFLKVIDFNFLVIKGKSARKTLGSGMVPIFLHRKVLCKYWQTGWNKGKRKLSLKLFAQPAHYFCFGMVI